DRDWLDLVCYGLDCAPTFGRGYADPAGEVLSARGAVSSHITSRHLLEGLLRIFRVEWPYPLVGAHECDRLALAGTEAEVATKGRRLEHGPPAGAHRLA